MKMICWARSFSLVFIFFAAIELSASGDVHKMISTPDKPTRVYSGKDVSFAWKYYQPRHLNVPTVEFGFYGRAYGNYHILNYILMRVNGNGVIHVNRHYKSRLSWAGNLSSYVAAFVLHNVQPEDQKYKYGIRIDFGWQYRLLGDMVRLEVKSISNSDLPRINEATTPPPLRIGQITSLNCKASGLLPVKVTWYKGNKALANGFSKAVFTLTITDKDWGEFICVAENLVGEDRKTVFLKVFPESPTVLNTNQSVWNVSWNLRWSAVYSEGHLVMLYTVWHRVVHVTKDINATREKPWSRENVTGFMYHKELAADTTYMFAVTAWNRWGESLLETDKVLYISTDPVKTTKKVETTKEPTTKEPTTKKPTYFVYTVISVISEPRLATTPLRTPFESDEELDFTLGNEVFIWGALAVFLCISLPVVVICFLRRKQRRKREKDIWQQQGIGGVTLVSNRSEGGLTTETAQDTGERSTSEKSSEPASLAGSLSVPEKAATSVRSKLSDYNQTRECSTMLTALRKKTETIAAGSTSHQATPYKGSESSKDNQEIRMSVIYKTTTPEPTPKHEVDKQEHVPTPEENYRIALDVNEDNAADDIQEIDQETKTGQVEHAKDYLRPVGNRPVQDDIKNATSSQMSHGKSQALALKRPQPKPRFQVFGKKRKDKSFQCKHSAVTGTCQGQQQGYQNAQRPVETRVLSSSNWEVSRDHLSLFERIGGGSFGQVWRGAVFSLDGDQKWSVVAVKMIKENSSYSDLRDLLSELDLLKKLKPHPNVIQLLGCLTREVIRYEDGREFRPPLVILEFVPHGDLLGYLKKSRGETDDYYNLKSAKVPQKIPTQQLYRFASDIARGMEFISSHQLIHRDLAARNVLVGEGLRCKITDFGMARDLGKAEIYVRRSNGLMPVKWMAIESLTSEVFTTKSDVWSYGIVLYEIFTLGKNPYKGMTGEAVFQYVASGRRLTRSSAMSSELYDLILECWHEDPCKRPTFGSILDRMETLVGHDP